MKIDGKAIAESIYVDLTERIRELKKNGIVPTLAVVLIGDDPGSVSYIAQKEKFAKQIGLTLKITKLPATVSQQQLQELIALYNADISIRGIIIQRPAPEQIEKEILDPLVIPEKDVDGFHPNSDFAAPVALAVEKILYEVYKEIHQNAPFVSSLPSVSFDTFLEWLISKDMVVLGKGQTAGTPIISHFHGRNAQVTVIDTQTEHPLEIINEADIIVSAVGKQGVFPPEVRMRDKILIGIGLHMEEGKLRGDYVDSDVDSIAAFYTPTPGGVGPVNVAMLLSNVVRATEEQTGTL